MLITNAFFILYHPFFSICSWTMVIFTCLFFFSGMTCNCFDKQGEVRNQISALETDLMHEKKKSASAIVRVGKYVESRREMDRKLDIQYQRNM